MSIQRGTTLLQTNWGSVMYDDVDIYTVPKRGRPEFSTQVVSFLVSRGGPQTGARRSTTVTLESTSGLVLAVGCIPARLRRTSSVGLETSIELLVTSENRHGG